MLEKETCCWLIFVLTLLFKVLDCCTQWFNRVLLVWLHLDGLPSAIRAKHWGEMMPLWKDSIITCLMTSQVFAPTTTTTTFSYACPQPLILGNRKCILLNDGWAPCSCWEKGGGGLYFPPEQSDEFSSFKSWESTLLFGSVLEPLEPACLKKLWSLLH